MKEFRYMRLETDIILIYVRCMYVCMYVMYVCHDNLFSHLTENNIHNNWKDTQ
jgi:hypothetical protein